MAPRLERVDHIHVFVNDRTIAEQWYADVMGFHRVTGLEFWATDGGPLTIGDASGSIHLALFERPSQAVPIDRCLYRECEPVFRLARSSCRGTEAIDATPSITRWHGHFTSAIPMEIPSRSRAMTTLLLATSSRTHNPHDVDNQVEIEKMKRHLAVLFVVSSFLSGCASCRQAR